jgi:hypothetical protein
MAATMTWKKMKTYTDLNRLTAQDKLALLAHLYLELELAPADALSAAAADLQELDAFTLVAEAA